MPLTLRSLLTTTAPSSGSLPNQEAIWKALLTCMGDTLRTTKGISIKNLFSITMVRTSTRAPTQGLKNPVFFLSSALTRSYGVTYSKPGTGLTQPCLEVNISKICVITGLTKDEVVGGIKGIAKKLGEVMGSGGELGGGVTGADDVF